MTIWAHSFLEEMNGDGKGYMVYIYLLPAMLALLLLVFGVFDWLNVQRTRKLILNAAKTSEVVTQMFPGQFRDKVLDQTKVMKGDHSETETTERSDAQALAELFPNVTVFMADIAGFTAWSSVR